MSFYSPFSYCTSSDSSSFSQEQFIQKRSELLEKFQQDKYKLETEKKKLEGRKNFLKTWCTKSYGTLRLGIVNSQLVIINQKIIVNNLKIANIDNITNQELMKNNESKIPEYIPPPMFPGMKPPPPKAIQQPDSINPGFE